ncbi:malto-oligosyltrehalose trehalohydrolase [Kineosporiaceae bacterium SCSIO 59966]|nr:malto-oligosyltrehalose trehalohydrolase [Kineosporiaceae bacterium SCSIO 59966]
MHRFTVWAPDAARVDVDLSGSLHPMTRQDDGWWAVEVPGAGHGTDYAFRLDGGEPTPDPRSPWQPDGVHAPSRVFDTGRHAWADDGWAGLDVRGRLFYELHVGTFTPEGTLDAAAQRLDHLVDLGVEVVELMPVAAFPGRWGWGYDGVALYAVHEPYGGPAALQRFVDACHRRGLAVCLDVVYNHLGPSGNYLSRFGPYFTDRHHTPWGQAVNLDDAGSEHVRRWIVDNALRWFAEFHVDALRLDAVHALVDDSAEHVLAQLSRETADLADRLGRPLGLVAESDLNDPRMVEPVAEGGLGMTAQWDDDVHHAIHALLSGERQGYYCDFGSTDALAKVLTRAFLHDGTFSTFRGQRWGRPVDPARHRGTAFLAYAANHDQVGNRATGDRPSAYLSPGRLACAAALVLTSPFTPMLFMGEEWGASSPWQFFTDHAEPELAESIRQGRQREFAEHGWDDESIPDPQDHATRDASVLRWDERSDGEHAPLLDWHRSLVALRRGEPDLRDDDLAAVGVRHSDLDRWMVLERGSLRVVLNLADRDQVLPLDAAAVEVVLAWDEAVRLEESGTRVAVPAESVAVLRLA